MPNRLQSKRRALQYRTRHLLDFVLEIGTIQKSDPPSVIDDDVIRGLLKINGRTSCVYHHKGFKDKDMEESAEGESYRVNLPDCEPSSVVDKDTLFAIGSFTKTIIATAIGILIKEPGSVQDLELGVESILKGGLTASTFTVLNELRLFRGQKAIRTPDRIQPTLKQLLLHMEAFAPFQRYLFDPAGKFLMSDGVFEKVMAAVGNESKDPSSPQVRYSNWNYIVAGMIVQLAMGRKTLAEALKILVLRPLEMHHTVVDLEGFGRFGKEMAKAHIVTVNERKEVERPCYVNDTSELAAGGGYSCTGDVARLLEFLVGKFADPKWKDFFECHKTQAETFTYWNTIIGNYGPLDSPMVSMQSYDRIGQTTQYQLGAGSRGSHEAISKAGAVKGYSCHYYVLPHKRSFIIVLTNSSGVLDTSSHIGQYILQQLLGLKPQVDFVHEAQTTFNRNRHYLGEPRPRNLHQSEQHPLNQDEIRKLVGVFKDTISQQELHIESESKGEVVAWIDSMSQSVQKRTQTLRVAKVSGDTLTLSLRSDEPTIDGYGAWFRLVVKMRKEEGRLLALEVASVPGSASEKVVYARVQ